MKYMITGVKQVEEVVVTSVDYDFDGVKVSVDVSHYMPRSKAEIKEGIVNRAQSEKRKLLALADIEALMPQIAVNKEEDVE
jgi:hypothetical protein